MFLYNQQQNPDLKTFKEESSFKFIKSPEYINCKISYDQQNNILNFSKDALNSKPLKLTTSCIIKYHGSPDNLSEFEFIETYKKYNSTVKSYLITILNKLHDLNTGYKVQVGLYYKHFPFKIKIQTNRIIITNYLGYKSDIILPYKNLTITQQDDKTLSIEGYDRIQILNFVSQLERIRYKTKLSKLDPRKFADSIYKKVY